MKKFVFLVVLSILSSVVVYSVYPRNVDNIEYKYENLNTKSISIDFRDGKGLKKNNVKLYLKTPIRDILIPENRVDIGNGKVTVSVPSLLLGDYYIKIQEKKFYFTTLKYKGVKYNECSKMGLSEGDWHSCYTGAMAVILYNDNNPKKYIDIISTGIYSDTCHEVSHILGREEYTINSNIDDIVNLGGDKCLSGYEHGVFEAMSFMSDTETLKKKLPSICSPNDPDEAKINCTHSLGHLVYFRENDLDKSLQYCKILEIDPRSAVGCADGVTMSYLIDLNQDGSKASMGNYISLCNGYHDDLLIEGCYAELNFYFQNDTNPNYQEIGAGCNSLINPTSKENCYLAYGRFISQKISNTEESISLCKSSSKDSIDINSCLTGGAIYSSFAFSDKAIRYEKYCNAFEGINKAEACSRVKKFFKIF